jgi:DNA-binding CsgD family transcriptional regulator
VALKPTLYIALNNTHLEDFADHMNTNLREWCKTAWPRLADITTWIVNEQPDEVWTMGRNLNKTTILYIKAFQPTSTRYAWDATMPPIEGASIEFFYIEARRYQHDRVEVSLFGRDTAKLEELIMTWVEAHWKKQVGVHWENQYEEMNPEDAPQPHFPPQQLAKRDKYDLEPRYNKVAHLIAIGKDDAEIAKQTATTEGTIEKYRKDIAAHFGVSSTPAILRAKLIELGYGDDGG